MNVRWLDVQKGKDFMKLVQIGRRIRVEIMQEKACV
jgi:hypothetical protein